MVVKKSDRSLIAYHLGKKIKQYTISLGGQPIGPKEKEGDQKTPEGLYFIDSKNPDSGYYKNLGVSYPNKIDKERCNKSGLKPGGAIKIHGIRNGLGFLGKLQRWVDWTAGCISVTNDEMDEIYENTKVGTPILILP